MKRIVLMMIAVLALIGSVSPTAAQSSRCSGLDEYQQAVYDSVPDGERQLLTDFIEGSLEVDTMRPSQVQRLSQALDDWASGLEEIPLADVPLAARDYHKTLIETISVMSSVTFAIGNGNMFGAIAYTETLEELTLDMERIQRTATKECGADWPFGV